MTTYINMNDKVIQTSGYEHVPNDVMCNLESVVLRSEKAIETFIKRKCEINMLLLFLKSKKFEKLSVFEKKSLVTNLVQMNLRKTTNAVFSYDINYCFGPLLPESDGPERE